jgi:hypothetical protein
MSAGGKGDKRRPGSVPDGAWERVFKPEACTRCGGAHALSECKWPLVAAGAGAKGGSP